MGLSTKIESENFKITEPCLNIKKRHNVYRTLRISFYSPIEKAKEAYIRKAKQIDFSKDYAEKELLNLNLAYQTISNPKRKKEYDVALAMKDPSITLISREPLYTPLLLSRSDIDDLFTNDKRGRETLFGRIIPKKEAEEWEKGNRGYLLAGKDEITLVLQDESSLTGDNIGQFFKNL